MTALPEGREGQRLALGVLVLVVGVLLLALRPAGVWLFDAYVAIREREAALLDQGRVLARQPAGLDRKVLDRARTEHAGYFVSIPTSRGASSAMGKLIRTRSSPLGVQVRQVMAWRPAQHATSSLSGALVRADLPAASLLKWMSALEQGSPPLLIKRVNINAAANGSRLRAELWLAALVRQRARP